MRRARPLAAVLALASAACGRYANVAQKLDVTARVAGDTWITAVDPSGGANRTEIRLLLVGAPDANGAAPFAFSALEVAHSRGDSVWTLQGTWVEMGTSGAATAYVAHAYTLPDESDVSILLRRGTWRSDDAFQIPLTVIRTTGRLTVAGDARLAGTYVPLTEALGNLATATESDAACAFQVANLGMLRSEGRILGFGGPQIQQYSQAATYMGTVSGSLVIGFSGNLSSNTTTITYSAFEDVGGATVTGPMVTRADSGGNGRMSGVMHFEFDPIASDGTPLPRITGTIDYGADAIVISSGTATGGNYTVAFDGGGGTALVPPETAPSPSVSECLALP